MYGTRGIGAHFVDGTNIAAFGDDGVGGVLTHLELRTLGLLFGLRFLVPDGDVLVARENLAAFRRFAIRGTDLHQLRLRCDLLSDMRTDLGLIAVRIGALCGIWANSKSFLLAPCRRAPRVSQLATQPIASTEIGDGVPSSAGNF